MSFDPLSEGYVRDNAGKLANIFFDLKNIFENEDQDLILMILLSFIATRLHDDKSSKQQLEGYQKTFHLFQNFITREIIPFLRENDDKFNKAYKEYESKRDKIYGDEETE